MVDIVWIVLAAGPAKVNSQFVTSHWFNANGPYPRTTKRQSVNVQLSYSWKSSTTSSLVKLFLLIFINIFVEL